jgi:hypothetical protein
MPHPNKNNNDQAISGSGRLLIVATLTPGGHCSARPSFAIPPLVWPESAVGAPALATGWRTFWPGAPLTEGRSTLAEFVGASGTASQDSCPASTDASVAERASRLAFGVQRRALGRCCS